MDRAYSFFEVKSFDADKRIIAGVATTPTVDRVGDVVDPLGASFQRSIPLLLHHDTRLPVGLVTLKSPSSDGIAFEAQLPDITEPGALRDRVSEAWQSIKAGLIKGVSIGFRAMEDGVERLKSGGLKFTKYEVLELSLVSVPANHEASIHVIRSIDQPFLAASGTGQGQQQVRTPGVTGAVVRLASKGATTTMTKSINEQIAGFEAKRAANVARMNEIQQKATDEGRNKDQSEKDEFDTLNTENKGIDAELVDLRVLEESNKAAAVPVAGASMQQASDSRGGQVITVKDNRPAGIGFARVALAKIAARLESKTVTEVIAERWPSDSGLKAYFSKAAVPAGSTTVAAWAGNLVDTTNLASEFLEYLRPQTIIGRLPLRRVPFNVRVTGQSTGAVANWVGQGKAKPVTSFSTTATTLLFTKIAAISVITEELARFSSPSAEALVRDELARAVIERMDIDFIDPAQAAVANVSPASITNGVTPLSSAGTSADNIRTDLQNLLEAFLLQNMNAANVVLIMPNTLALAASMLTNSLGQPEFPGIGINGGNLRGIPVVTSQYAANQSGSGNLIIALDPTAIFLADDGQVTLDASREASIEMSDAPSGDSTVPTAASLVSMYQTNSIALRAERFINWAKARSGAVAFIDDANWGSIGSPS